MKIEAEEALRLKERFVLRAKIVCVVRFGLIVAAFFSLLFSIWTHGLPISIDPKQAFFSLAISTVWVGFSTIFAENARFGRIIFFITLSLDLVVIFFSIQATHGFSSPAMALIPIYSLIFTLLFHSPISVAPPLLLLPIVTVFDTQLGQTSRLFHVLSYLAIYGVLSAVAIYITHCSLAREESQNLEIIRLERRLKRLAILEERTRLARDLHDGIGAALSAIIIQTEYLRSITSETRVKTEVQELKATSEEAMEEMRRAVTIMRNEFDLLSQLKQSCQQFSARHRLPISFQVDGILPNLPHPTQLMIFRILQESLTNIAKHAKASQIQVRLEAQGGPLSMKIIDDGIGFNDRNTPKNHYGLQNMKERARQIGGHLQIDSREGLGTEVTICIDPVNVV